MIRHEIPSDIQRAPHKMRVAFVSAANEAIHHGIENPIGVAREYLVKEFGEEPTENFDPDQPRDEDGKWTGSGGSGSGGGSNRDGEAPSPNKGEYKATVSGAIQTAISKARSKQPHETMMAVLSDGTVLTVEGMGTGFEATVGFTGQDRRKIDKDSNTTLIHTHPVAVGFSRGDVSGFLADDSVRKIVVADPEGTVYELQKKGEFSREMQYDVMDRFVKGVTEWAIHHEDDVKGLTEHKKAGVYSRIMTTVLQKTPTLEYKETKASKEKQ